MARLNSSHKEGDTQSDSSRQENPKRSLSSFLGDLLFYVALIGILLAGIAFKSNQQGVVHILGYSPMLVLSGSMEPEIPKEALIITKYTDPDQIEVGDDITFLVNDAGRTYTHRVIETIEEYEETGERGFRTQGIASEWPDEDIVLASNIVGVVQVVIPNVGFVWSWIKERYIYIIIFIAILIGFKQILKRSLEED